MSTTDHPPRVAVETPRGAIRAGPVVDERPVTDNDRLGYELLVDLGDARFWVTDTDINTDGTRP